MKNKKVRQLLMAVILTTNMVMTSFPMGAMAAGAAGDANGDGSAVPKIAAPVQTQYPVLTDANGNVYDLGGMEIIVRDWWSSEGIEAEDEYSIARQNYLDWIQEEYNFTIKQIAISDWGDVPEDFYDYVDQGGDDVNYVFTLRADPLTLEAMDLGMCYDLSTLDCLDFSEAKFQNNQLHEQYSRNGKIYAMSGDDPEPRTGIYFNKRILAEAGIDPDSLYDMQSNGTWTWGALVDLLDQVKSYADQNRLSVYGMDCNNPLLVEAAVYSNGGQLIGKNQDGVYGNELMDPKAIEGLHYAQSLFENYWTEEPEDASWNYYSKAFVTGECAFLVDQAYLGSYGINYYDEFTKETFYMQDNWGFVMFPKGQQASDYVNVWDNNPVVIPACYDAERAWKIAFAWNLFTNEVPGYENSDVWKQAYSEQFDTRAVDETLNMMRTKGKVTYVNMVPGLDPGPDLLWSFGPGENPLADPLVVEEVADKWNKLVGDLNANLDTFSDNPHIIKTWLGEGRVLIKWYPNNDIDHYLILRKEEFEDGGDGEWIQIAQVNWREDGKLFADDTIKENTFYTYAIVGVSEDGKTVLTETSEEAYVSTYGEDGGHALVWLGNLQIKWTKEDKPYLNLSWDSVSGVENYRVFRMSEDGNWMAVADVEGLKFADYNITPGKAYYYTVQGVSLDGTRTLTGMDEMGISRWIPNYEIDPSDWEILRDPDGNVWDLGGMEIIIRDWWSSEGSEGDDEYSIARKEYLDWIQKTYNFKIKRKMISEWGDAPQDFYDYASSGGDEKNYAFVLHSSQELRDAEDAGLCWDLSKLDCLDFQDEKFQLNLTHKVYSRGNKIYGMSDGASEPRTGVYFNKRLLSEAGIDPNSLYEMQAAGTWTWEAFLELCAQVQRDIDGDKEIDVYGFGCNNGVLTEAAVFSNNGSFIDKDASGKYVYQLESANTLEALRYAKQLFDNYRVQDPEGSTWDYYKTAFADGECAFLIDQSYMGSDFNGMLDIYVDEDTYIDNTLVDDWGFVMFPKGPKATDYVNAWDNNPVCIPSCYDADRAWKIAFAWNLYTNEVPGYEGNDTWQFAYHEFEPKAINSTLSKMRANGTVSQISMIEGIDLGPDLTWNISPNGPSVEEVVESISDTWKMAVDDENEKLGFVILDKSSPKLLDPIVSRNAIGVRWIANRGVEQYAIFRKEKNGKWMKVGTTTGTDDGAKAKAGSDCYFEDAIAERDITYFYTVRGMNLAGKYITNYDNTGKAAILATVVLDKSAPALIGVTELVGTAASGVNLTWTANSGVDKYAIFRKTNGGKWEKVAVTIGTADGGIASAGTICSYFDASVIAGTTYAYTVRGVDDNNKYITAYDTTGKTIVYGVQQEVLDKSAPVLLNVTNVHPQAGAAAIGIGVEWRLNSGVEKYAIFRKTNGGKWEKIAVVSGNECAYLDTNVVAGSSYTYTVRGMDNSEKYVTSYDTTGMTIVSEGQQQEVLDKSAPVLLNVTNIHPQAGAAAIGIGVEWTANSGVDKYAIFRKTNGGKWEKIAVVTGTELSSNPGEKAQAGAACAYSDTSVAAGSTYTYTVRGVDNNDKYVTSYDTTGMTIVFEGQQQEALDKSAPVLTGATAIAGTAAWGIEVTWTANSGVDQYAIFRKTNGGKWVRMAITTGTADGGKAAAGTVCSYSDFNVQTGTPYVYTVRGINDQNQYVTSYDTNGIAVTVE